MDILKLKIPPPAVAFTMAALMWLVARVAPRLSFALPSGRIIAACIAIAGVLTALAGVAEFHRARTTVNPLHPEKASTLVTSGIYKFTRNPMYVGLLLVLLAWATYLSNTLAMFVLPAFIAYINRFQIGPEETALAKTFGDEFRQYTSRVRRWI